MPLMSSTPPLLFWKKSIMLPFFLISSESVPILSPGRKRIVVRGVEALSLAAELLQHTSN